LQRLVQQAERHVRGDSKLAPDGRFERAEHDAEVEDVAEGRRTSGRPHTHRVLRSQLKTPVRIRFSR
jgi:hypothetical protein